MNICIVPDCARPAQNKHKAGECPAHLQQRVRYGFTEYKPVGYRKVAEGVCAVPNCGRAVRNALVCTACLKKVHRYGITREELIALDQTHCQVCGTSDNVYIDHDHATGKFRGVLCRECNSALGQMHDDPALIRRLAEYVEAHV